MSGLKDDDLTGAGGRLPGAPDPARMAELAVRSATDFAIVTADLDGIITSWSPGAEHVMGWSAADAVGRPVGLFFTPEDNAAGQPEREITTARAHGAAYQQQRRWR